MNRSRLDALINGCCSRSLHSSLSRRGGACPAHRAPSASFVPGAAMSEPRQRLSPSVIPNRAKRIGEAISAPWQTIPTLVIPNEAGRFFLPVPVGPGRSACECEESLLRFVRRFLRGTCWIRRGLHGLWSHRFSDGQILAHFFEAFLSEPADRQQIVDALECAI
jgi:hypothetical protein